MLLSLFLFLRLIPVVHGMDFHPRSLMQNIKCTRNWAPLFPLPFLFCKYILLPWREPHFESRVQHTAFTILYFSVGNQGWISIHLAASYALVMWVFNAQEHLAVQSTWYPPLGPVPLFHEPFNNHSGAVALFITSTFTSPSVSYAILNPVKK